MLTKKREREIRAREWGGGVGSSWVTATSHLWPHEAQVTLIRYSGSVLIQLSILFRMSSLDAEYINQALFIPEACVWYSAVFCLFILLGIQESQWKELRLESASSQTLPGQTTCLSEYIFMNPLSQEAERLLRQSEIRSMPLCTHSPSIF